MIAEIVILRADFSVFPGLESDRILLNIIFKNHLNRKKSIEEFIWLKFVIGGRKWRA